MKRNARSMHRVWALLLGAALAGCGDFQRELEELCAARGTCACDGGSCCVLEGEFCDPGQCCGGLSCSSDESPRCVPAAQ